MVTKHSNRSVSEWVNYIQTLHVREIDLSLSRVRQVALALCPLGMPFKVISVAGTNGKGSTAEIISSIYNAAGYTAGKFTSPHLVRFNERFTVGGVIVDDAQLLDAFKSVEQARADVPITYFEYGLLLAIALFVKAKVDIAIMEVGLGGRLDAVNILDADVAIICSIALDHTAWLGDSLEKIAFEKVGIARPNKPCVIGVKKPQNSLIQHLDDIGAHAIQVGRDFQFTPQNDHSWTYQSEERTLNNLSLPFGQSGVQLSNAALAITAVGLLQDDLKVAENKIKQGIANSHLAGRCQCVSSNPLIVLDVSHNEASVIRLREYLETLNIKGRVLAVCGMLKDKEVAASLSQIHDLVDQWYLTSIDGDRGSSANDIESCLYDVNNDINSESITLHDASVSAFKNAQNSLTSDDCLLVFGSFYVVGDILNNLNENEGYRGLKLY